jgi:hypothetical protein
MTRHDDHLSFIDYRNYVRLVGGCVRVAYYLQRMGAPLSFARNSQKDGMGNGDIHILLFHGSHGYSSDHV